MHECAAIGCEDQIPSEHLMCHGHWFQVPKEIRDRVWSGYRGEDEGYEHAVEEAIAAVAAVDA